MKPSWVLYSICTVHYELGHVVATRHVIPSLVLVLSRQLHSLVSSPEPLSTHTNKAHSSLDRRLVRR